MTKRILAYLASMVLASLGVVVSATPASAGECFWYGCPGGEVWNNAPSGSIVLTNCWKDSYGEWKVAETLDCQTGGDNRFMWPARTRMPRAYYSGDWSNDGSTVWFADVDGIRFDRGCDTSYKFENTGVLVERRKGMNTDVWRKIDSVSNVEIISIDCDYRVTNGNSAQCLAIGSSSTANGAEAIQWGCITTSLGQQWYIQAHPTAPGWVWIKNRHSEKCLAIGSSSTANGAEAIQWDCITTSNGQKWRLDSTNFNYFLWGFHVVNGSGKCLAIGSGSTTPGANAIQWDCIWTSYSQRWGFFSLGNGADPLT